MAGKLRHSFWGKESLSEMAAGEGWHAVSLTDLRDQARDLGIDPREFGRSKRGLAQAIIDAGGSVDVPEGGASPRGSRRSSSKTTASPAGSASSTSPLDREIAEIENAIEFIAWDIRITEDELMFSRSSPYQVTASPQEDKLRKRISDLTDRKIDLENKLERLKLEREREQEQRMADEKRKGAQKAGTRRSGKEKIPLERIWDAVAATANLVRTKLGSSFFEVRELGTWNKLPTFAIVINDLPTENYMRGASYPFELRANAAKRIEKLTETAVERVTGKGSVDRVDVHVMEPRSHKVAITVNFALPTKERKGTKKWSRLNDQYRAERGL